jgi:hypothetical protein
VGVKNLASCSVGKHELRVFKKNRVLRSIFGPKMGEGTGYWR